MRFLLFLALAAARLAHAALPDFLPPGTKVIVGFSLRNLVDSPLLKSFGSDAKTMTSGFTAGGPLAGLDPLKDIDELLFASAGADDKAPALAVIYGRFDAARFSAGAKLYNGVPIFEDAKNPNGTAALLDASTMIGGNLTQVRAAIDRRGKGATIDAVLSERVQSLQSRFDLWGLGELPQGPSPQAAKPEGWTQLPPELQSIDRFEFGASLRSGLEFGGQIHVSSAKDAEKLMQSMKLLEMMVKMQVPSTGGTKFDLQADQDTIKVSFFIPEEELKKGIETQKASLAAMATQSKPSPKPVVKALPPIEGSIVKNQHGDAVTVTLPRKN